MRILIFAIFWPMMALAQPTAIAPESVIGFLQMDTNGDGHEERVLLTLSDSNDVDLYIMPDTGAKPLAYVQAFTAINNDRLTLVAAGNSAFDVVQTTRHGQGTTVFSQRIGWVNGADAGYFTIGLTLRIYPRYENASVIDCTIDFLNGRLETTINEGEMQVFDVNMAPTRPGAPLPEGWNELCAG